MGGSTVGKKGIVDIGKSPVKDKVSNAGSGRREANIWLGLRYGSPSS